MVSVTPWYAHGFYKQILEYLMAIIDYKCIQLTGSPELYSFCYQPILYSVDTRAGNMSLKGCPSDSAEVGITCMIN